MPSSSEEEEQSSSLQSGVGMELTPFTRLLLTIYLVSLGSFVLGFLGLHCLHRKHSEQSMIFGAISWMRITSGLLVVCHVILLALEAERRRSVEFPHFGLVGPIFMFSCTLVAFFTNSHRYFRWLVCTACIVLSMNLEINSYSSHDAQTVLANIAFIVLETFHLSNIDMLLRCRMDHDCEADTFWTLSQLRILWPRGFAALFLEIWSILIVSYLGAALGWMKQRYPPRMFSTSQPPHRLADSERRLGK